MALVVADRVWETTSTSGTGTLTLSGAVSGYQTFAVIGDGNTTYYTITNGTDWEVGIGTYTSSGTTLSRDTVLSSSLGGTTKINVTPGSFVFVDYPASKAVYEDASGNVTGYPISGGTINGTTIGATTPAAGTFTTLTGNSTSQFGRSSANYAQITGAAAGSDPTLSALGSDTNINFTYLSKGSAGEHRFSTNTGGNTQFRITHTGSSANYVQVTGGITGTGVLVSAQGSDTNIPLALQPKGTGAIQAQATTSSTVGGNTRGANATDWQTSRSSAGQVASGTYATLSGGINNTVSGFGAAVLGGGTNTASVTYGAIGGGTSNNVGSYSYIGGGQSNSGTGLFNFIGGGFTNSGTSSSAVTTQSGTMNGTTAVTLSGSNASIKVGQAITGTSITTYTYVAAISGTSLTLSQAASGSSTSTLSFFTPHGVVVGGGNNQATGSYSFIGGGGDAGTAANRNVASGDWSFVGSGQNNTASGKYSAILGYYATASGISAIALGDGPLASGSAAIAMGRNGIANSAYSTAMGMAGSTRSITGYIAFSAQYNSVGTTNGNAQAGLLILAKQTTDATATALTSDGGAASTTNQVILPNNSAYFFTGEVVSGKTAAGDTKGWTIEGVIKRGANAASTALVGVPTVTSTYADAGASTWDIAVTADTTNGGIRVTFTGQAATTIRTVCQIRTTEMTF